MMSMPASWEFRHIEDPLQEEGKLMAADLAIDLSDASHISGAVETSSRSKLHAPGGGRVGDGGEGSVVLR